jgi:hypothetical protein
LKHTLLIAFLLVIAGSTGHAQGYPKSVGVRTSFSYDQKPYAGAEFSFQSDVGRIGRRETNFGWWASNQWDVLKFTGIRQWKAVNKERFHIYGGGGLGAGLVMFPFAQNEFFATVNLDFGVDYTFAFPIQIALDWRPEWTVINNFGTPLGYEVGLAIRFSFGS